MAWMLHCMSAHTFNAKEHAMHPDANSATVLAALFARLLAAVCVTFAGCGTAVLKESRPLESPGVVAEAKDARILASIETVILRNGPGTWARDAEWDEYLIRIRALSDEAVEIREIVIFDALDQRIKARSDRGDLVDGTREIERRYQQSGQLVRDREGNVWGAVGAGVGGAAIIVASAAPATIAGAATFFTAGFVAVIAGAHFAGAAVERMLINAEIKRRHTTLPVTVPSGKEASLDLFFPITPLSGRTQVVYADRHGEHRLDIGIRAALLELPPPPTLVTRRDPDFPGLARRQGIIHGYVVAHLTLDKQGRVQNVNVIQSVPPGVFDAKARWTFQDWTYTGGHPGRTVEAKLEFKR